MSDHPTVFVGSRKYIEWLVRYFHYELNRIAGFPPMPPCVLVTDDSQIGYGNTPVEAFSDLVKRSSVEGNEFTSEKAIGRRSGPPRT